MVAACATIVELVPVSYRFVDDPANREFRLSFRNTTRHSLCLNPEDWPNAAGKINQASDRVAIIIGDRRFPIQDFNTGYCIGGCPIRVRPGEEVAASISYSDFEIPAALYSSDKRLEFSPHAFRC